MKRKKELVVASVTLIRSKPTLCYGPSPSLSLSTCMNCHFLPPCVARQNLTSTRFGCSLKRKEKKTTDDAHTHTHARVSLLVTDDSLTIQIDIRDIRLFITLTGARKIISYIESFISCLMVEQGVKMYMFHFSVLLLIGEGRERRKIILRMKERRGRKRKENASERTKDRHE